MVTFLDGKKSAAVVIKGPHWRAIKSPVRYCEIRVRLFTRYKSGHTQLAEIFNREQVENRVIELIKAP